MKWLDSESSQSQIFLSLMLASCFSFLFCNSGEQLANHISNINLLTTKLGLLCSLEEYQRVQEKMAKNKLVIIT